MKRRIPISIVCAVAFVIAGMSIIQAQTIGNVDVGGAINAFGQVQIIVKSARPLTGAWKESKGTNTYEICQIADQVIALETFGAWNIYEGFVTNSHVAVTYKFSGLTKPGFNGTTNTAPALNSTNAASTIDWQDNREKLIFKSTWIKTGHLPLGLVTGVFADADGNILYVANPGQRLVVINRTKAARSQWTCAVGWTTPQANGTTGITLNILKNNKVVAKKTGSINNNMGIDPNPKLNKDAKKILWGIDWDDGTRWVSLKLEPWDAGNLGY